jgi:hypothetical protein
LFQIGIFIRVEETPENPVRKQSVLKAGASTTYLPVRIELVIERNTPAT